MSEIRLKPFQARGLLPKALQKTVLIKQENEKSALRGAPEAEWCDQAQGKASVHGDIGLHGFIAAIVRSVRILAQGNPVVDDAAG